MKLKIIPSESGKSADKAYALFFVKQSVQFSKVLTDAGSAQVETVLKGIKDGRDELLEKALEKHPTINPTKNKTLETVRLQCIGQ